jgi:hypothetical protein
LEWKERICLFLTQFYSILHRTLASLDSIAFAGT